MKKAIIYGRVSTMKQDYTRQINELTKYASNNGFEVVKVFTDIQTGKSKASRRKGAKEMFLFLESEKIDIVLVSEISRLGRSAIDVQKNIDAIVFQQGTNLYIHQQGMTARNKDGKVNTTFKLISDVLANVAQMESEQISERVKSGIQESIRKRKQKGEAAKWGRQEGTVKTDDKLLTEYKKVKKELEAGTSIRKTAKLCDVSPATVQKVKRALAAT